MRISIIFGTAILGLATSWLAASENAPLSMAPGAAWMVDPSNTIAYRYWLRLGSEFRPAVRSILTSETGNLQYWIRVGKGARGTIAVAVGEGYYTEPGRRLMDIVIDGRVRASRIDPITVAGGSHRLAVIACEAEDLDGDGLLHVQIVASKGSPDRVTLDAGLWWFAGKNLSAQQAATLPRLDCELKPDLFISHGFEGSPLHERYSRQIHTEDPKLNALLESLYDRCVWGALREPTMAMDEPKFGANAMWRGDMWPATTYLVAGGLNRYGYHDLARQLADRMRRLIAEHGLNERYNAKTGQAIGEPYVAMTCSAWPLLVQGSYGVQDDFRTIVVPPGARGRRLRLGKLEVSYPEDDVVELRSAFDRPFRVIFAGSAGPLKPVLKCDNQDLPSGTLKLENGAVVFTARAGRTYTLRRSDPHAGF